MKRISRDELAMGIASLYAKRGTCGRRQVGCCLVTDGRVIASGYNGTLPGHPHCSIIDPRSTLSCDPASNCQHAVHAEANMIAYCARHGIKTEGTHLYSTSFPCKKCAELIIQAGISEVTFSVPYSQKSDEDVNLMFLLAKIVVNRI